MEAKVPGLYRGRPMIRFMLHDPDTRSLADALCGPDTGVVAVDSITKNDSNAGVVASGQLECESR